LFHGYYSERITKLRAAKILTISVRRGAIIEARTLKLMKERYKSLHVKERKNGSGFLGLTSTYPVVSYVPTDQINEILTTFLVLENKNI